MDIVWRNHLDINRVCGRHAGDIGERIAWIILTQNGYDIWDFSSLVDSICERLTREELERIITKKIIYSPQIKKNKDNEYDIADKFFNSKYTDNFIKYCCAWNIESKLRGSTIRPVFDVEHRREAERNNTFSLPSSGPDYVGKKDDKFYIIEVKTNSAVLQRHQKKMLLLAKDFGFIPLLVKMRVDIKVPLEKVEIKEL